MRTVLLSPAAFFRGRDRTSLLLPGLLVYLYALLASGVPILASEEIRTAALSIDIAGLVGAMAIAALIVAPAMWILEGGVMYLVSGAFGGAGEFRKLLSFVAWGYVPQIFAAAILGAAEVVLAGGGTPPVTVPVTVGGHLWQAYIWVYAVKYARDITQKSATITVSILLAFNLFATLFPLL